ncbi:MAG: iron-sulfur cluster assembly scaffold protein [Deltaproteobacteria bacterium]|nr:iron-sulfur cluster assembly scaffold protein [Deltaproteobacteria bacterium]
MGDEFDRIIQVMQDSINEDTRATWGETAFQRWCSPPNMGMLPEADSRAELRGSCGDTMVIYLKFANGKTSAATFETDGCGPSIVCGSIAAELALGKTAEEILDINGDQVLAQAGQIPEDHHHCAFLAAATLHEAVNRFMKMMTSTNHLSKNQ